jgi:5'/3'-nucleotidase SurE
MLSVVVGACLIGLAAPAAALNIALTNDDGWSATGIQVMKTALEAAGHKVTLAAPLTDQSGASMGFDQQALLVKKEAERMYSVALLANPTLAAKPSNSAYVALAIIAEGGQPADLLISGINTSPNVGISAILSGTVGAANHAAASVLNGPVPAIAVGTDEPNCNGDLACKTAHYQVVANFMVNFIAHLETKPGFLASEAALLPRGVALIVSYPGTASVSGVRIGVQGESILLNGLKVAGDMKCLNLKCSTLPIGGTAIAGPSLKPDYTPEIKDSDVGYYTEGYVTIVPISPDLTAANPLKFKSILPGLGY